MNVSLKRFSITLVLLFVSGFGLLFFLPLPALMEKKYFSTAVYDNQHHLIRLSLSEDEKYRLFTPLASIAKELKEATLLQEDYYFYSHFGINPWSTLKAVWQTYVAKSRRVGASTITMQVARMRYGIHSKEWSGKLWQMLRALQIEMHYSKKQILEAYLNLAPYGGNIEGVGAASLIYFHTSADQLTLNQALTLSVIPQNPGKRTPKNENLKNIRDHLFQRWIKDHPEDLPKARQFNLPLVMFQTNALPFIAPHFVNHLLRETPRKEQIETTLDIHSQAIVERITKNYLARKKRLGVENTAILLVDTQDLSIKAALGSADFFNSAIGGQINGVEIKRSPGSTLKPLIYGLAFDQGLIHPNTVLKDVPQSFNGYNPENFDYDFMGPVKAKDALVLSRNIPAIYLANQLKPSLHQLLEQAEVSQLRAESYYGLSLSLGSVELTMRELVGLYVMLVNDGLWFPIHALKNEKKGVGRRLLSPEASFLTLDILSHRFRGLGQEDSSNPFPIAWKTGTSSAYRDAWAVGVFGHYALGVWIGNFNNKTNHAFVGKDIASPLFFELIHGLRQEKGPILPLKSKPILLNLKKIEVCKASGLLPTRYCQDREWTWFIPGKSPIKTDTIYREVAINSETGLRACHINAHTRFEIFEFWPSDLLQIFKRAGIQRHTPPPFDANCQGGGNAGMSPQIISPQLGLNYVMYSGSSEKNRIPFAATTDAENTHVYWFINESFVAKTKVGETFFWQALPGKFVVRVVDEHGLSDARDLSVRLEG